jgi:cytochrome c oxidase subunit 3
MNPLRRLSEKSWLSPGAGPDPTEARRSAGGIGLTVYFGVATVMFSLIVAAYVMRMGMGGHSMAMGHEGDWRSMPKPGLLWFNTAMLIFASAFWEWARIGAQRGDADRMRRGLIGGGLLIAIFLIGQIIVWRQLDAAGFYLATNPANAFFYMITAIHGLHMIGGLAVWGRTIWRMANGAALTDIRLPVELCAIYCHYLLLVWLVMFGLLLST